MLCKIIICLKFSLAKIHLLWWYCLGQVRRLCHIRIMSRTPSVAILSLPEGSAVTAVERRCCRQRCEESWRRLAFCNEMIGKATSGLTNLLLFSLCKPTVLHLSISPLVYRTYLCNCFAVTSFNFYHSTSSVCPVTSFSLAAVHQRLHASQLSAQTTACCPAVYWCFWVSIQCYVFSFTAHIDPGMKKTSYSSKIISLFSPFDFYHLPSVVIHWLDVFACP